MASDIQQCRGHDHHFTEQPPDDLHCIVCLTVAKDPQQMNCCGKMLCRACLDDWSSHSSCGCPQCRVKIISFDDKRSNRHILSLQVRCDNTANGCEWTGELRLLDVHLTTCGFALLPCPNQCQKGNEVSQLLRKDLEKHTQEECPRRQYECPHCKVIGEYEERKTTHLEKCPSLRIPCPNPRCNTTVPRCCTSQHCQLQCMHQEVSCKYANIGCQKRVLRKDLEEHECDSQLHLQLAIDTVHHLKAKVVQQEAAIAQLQVQSQAYQKQPITFKVTNFECLQSSNESYYTPSFYTNPGGYKICIRVDAHGDGDGEVTHVSVYAYLENDNCLPWPFMGKITFELLNQLEDEHHHSASTTLPQENEVAVSYSQQDLNQEMGCIGYGHPYYIAHSELCYNAAKNCQYLKDDCLYFRIIFDSEINSKPWLNCTI